MNFPETTFKDLAENDLFFYEGHLFKKVAEKRTRVDKANAVDVLSNVGVMWDFNQDDKVSKFQCQ